MKSLTNPKSFLALTLLSGVGMLVAASSASAQSAFFDLRFTAGQSLPAGAVLSPDLSTLTLLPGTGPASVTFDVWVTVVGGGTPSNTGIDQSKFRAFSLIDAAGGAFSTGLTGGSSGVAQVGAVSAAGISPLFNGHVTASGAPTQTFKDYGRSTATTTPDGISDMGGTTSTADLGMTLGATSNAVFANNPGATPTGGSSPNGAGWQFDVARVTFNIGTATSSGKTQFFPLNPVTSAAAAISIDGGASFVNLTSGQNYLPGSALTFQVAGVQANDSKLNMQPATVSIDTLAGGVTVATTLTISNSSATNSGAFSGVLSTTTPGGGTASAPVSGSVAASSSSPAVVNLVSGPFSLSATGFTYTIQNTSNASDVQGVGANKQTSFSANYGAAQANGQGTPGVYGTQLKGDVLNNQGYGGIESRVVSASAGGGSDAGGRAVLLAGSNSSGGAVHLQEQWRARNVTSEANPGQSPPLPGGVTTGLITDVMDLSGMPASGESSKYVLGMFYDPARLPNEPGAEAALAAKGAIYMVSPTTATGDAAGLQYVNSVSPAAGNQNNQVAPGTARYGFLGPYTGGPGSFTATFGSDLTANMGAWGIDTSTHQVWAILSHNSTFAVVPEPATILLAGLGLLGIVAARRRVKK